MSARSRFGDRTGAPEPLRGLELGSKAALTAIAATLGTVVAHVAGGAPPPGISLVVIGIAVSVLVAVPLSGRAVSLPRLAGIVFASQALFHLFFVVAEPSAATQTMSSLPGHEGHLMSSLSGATPLVSDHAMHATPAMLLAHLVAGALTLLALHCGERILQRLIEAAHDAWRTVRVLVSVLIAPLATRHPVTIDAWPTPAKPDDAIRAWSGTRRGPPVRA